MKYLFCGLGSIGERHLANLLALGETDIIALRKKNKPLRNVKKELRVFSNLQDALNQKPDVAVIANPSSLHIALAIELAKNNCHLFIEKPLSTNLSGIKELQRIAKEKNLIIKMGFMMRYHPAILKMKGLLGAGIIGIPLFARVEWGEYLPAWHPWEDYRKTYSARKDMGGGPINTLCHDIDLITWFFGKPKTVFALKGKNSSLEISTEHSVEILLEFHDKFTAEVHLDFLQLPPRRIWEIVGDKGRIEFDYYENALRLYLLNSNNRNGYTEKKISFDNFERNQLFFSEIKGFIKDVRKLKHPDISLEDGIANLMILMAAHKSIQKNKLVKIDYVL